MPIGRPLVQTTPGTATAPPSGVSGSSAKLSLVTFLGYTFRPRKAVDKYRNRTIAG